MDKNMKLRQSAVLNFCGVSFLSLFKKALLLAMPFPLYCPYIQHFFLQTYRTLNGVVGCAYPQSTPFSSSLFLSKFSTSFILCQSMSLSSLIHSFVGVPDKQPCVGDKRKYQISKLYDKASKSAKYLTAKTAPMKRFQRFIFVNSQGKSSKMRRTNVCTNNG